MAQPIPCPQCGGDMGISITPKEINMMCRVCNFYARREQVVPKSPMIVARKVSRGVLVAVGYVLLGFLARIWQILKLWIFLVFLVITIASVLISALLPKRWTLFRRASTKPA